MPLPAGNRMRRLRPWIAVPCAAALVTLIGRSTGANATTIGFFYLAVVLALAAWGGWTVGAAASIAAMLCFNFFFLPPFGTLNIAEPSNWVALFAFLLASTLASRLVATARRQAEEAQRRRREVEVLYELCFSLFAVSQRPGVLGEAAARTLQAIGAQAGGLFLDGEGTGEPVSRIGLGAFEIDLEALARVRRTGTTLEVQEDGEVRTVYVPLHVGELLNGVLVARGAQASRAVLESAGRLLALAVERERLLGEAARLEVMRASDALKTSLLRAVSHDLRTPLTAMRLEAESLQRQLAGNPAALESVRSLAKEQERLARRIDNLLSLARLEAGVARPHPEPVPAADLFRAARESLSLVLNGRPIDVRVDARCPDLWADPSLTLEALVNLLENAARAAPHDQTIELAAGPERKTGGRVRLEVRDRGPGLPGGVRRLLDIPRTLRRSDAGSGDSTSGGLGLQIARSFAEANGGSLALLDRPGGGTVARLVLPAAPEPEEVDG
jgi:two-component system, OmpR family, sensor histidine kinase KdpD